MADDNVVELRPRKNKVVRECGVILEEAKSKIDLALAVFIGRSGGKRVAIVEPENGDGCGIEVVREFVNDAKPLIKDGEDILIVHLKRLAYHELEFLADQVKVIDNDHD